MPNRRLAACLAALALAAAVYQAGCADLIDSIVAQQVAIAVLARTPDAENPKTHEAIPGATTLTVFFGDVDTSSILPGHAAGSGSFSGLTGATIHLTFTDAGGVARDLVVPDKGGGSYLLTSVSEAALTYAQVDYTLTITYADKTYRMKVAAPAPTDIAEIAAAPNRVIADHAAGQALTVTRSVKAGAQNPIAFVDLASVSGSAKVDAYTNAPSDALGFLSLVVSDGAWRTDAFTIPGDKFTASTGYLVTLMPLMRGTATTAAGESALFVGSSFLAGAASGGGVVVP